MRGQNMELHALLFQNGSRMVLTKVNKDFLLRGHPLSYDNCCISCLVSCNDYVVLLYQIKFRPTFLTS